MHNPFWRRLRALTDSVLMLACLVCCHRFRTRPSFKGHKTPKFDQSFIFNLRGREDAIHFQIWNKERLGDDQIGRLDILLTQLDFSRSEQWFNIVAQDNFSKVCGQLLLGFRYHGRDARGSMIATSPSPPPLPTHTPVPVPVAVPAAISSSDFVEVVKPGVAYMAASAPPSVTTPPTTSGGPADAAVASAPTLYAPAYPSLEGQPPSYAAAAAAGAGILPPSYEAAVVAPPGGPGFAVATPVHPAAAPAYQTPVSPVYNPNAISSRAISPQYPGNAGYSTVPQVIMAQPPASVPAGYIQSSSTQSQYPGNAGYAQPQPVYAHPAARNSYVGVPQVVYANGYLAQPQVNSSFIFQPIRYQ
jgi:hypothetical protein